MSHANLPFAARLRGAAPSAVREILKVAEQPDVLSFAGGLPAPELFPAEAIANAATSVLSQEPGAALQYGVTEGHGPLREWVADRLTRKGVATKPDEILITHGSQQGIDLVARAFLDPGSRVVVEDPTYLFFVDVEGHIEDPTVKLACEQVRKRCERLEILGSYPRGESVES